MHKLLYLFVLSLSLNLSAAESWQSAMSRMPLQVKVAELNRTNCVDILLRSFQSNDTVKALIFMPGATDEFYMFRRAKAVVTNASPSLLDAINALTNQTYIRATFLPPYLLLHTDEDPLNPLSQIKNKPTADKLRQRPFVPYVLYNDRDWDFLRPVIAKKTGAFMVPKSHSVDSFHFYRHSFAAWNLTCWEALEAISLAGKTKFTVSWKMITFEGDERLRATPHLDSYPRN
ncbi:MAG: hypothetical protein JWQ71_305 [Pedosphaera sp.]|nr:hypothetical protein [Pedosphaera sp.]